MKKLKLIGLFIGLLLFGRNGFAQSPMNYAEYYWDTDPGYGLGTSLGAINTTNLNLTANVSATGLLVGNHNLNVRVRDANGIWSQLLTKVIMVAPEAYNPGTNAQDIRVFEYQWDAQTPVQATVSGIVNFEFIQTIPTTSLGEGGHILSIRMKDAYGFWTLPYQYNVSVYGAAPGDNISRIEYFIGTMTTDPGYGLATSASFTPASSPDVMANFEPTTTGLTNGENLITFRIKDSQNRWSSLYQKIFNLDPSFTLTAGGTFNQGNQAKSEFCLGGKIKVPITKTGTFPSENQYVLELSNSIGTNFVPIVTTINVTQDTLIGTLPNALNAASGYRIRAVTTLPLIRKTSATILTIGNTATATVTPASLCEGSSLQLNSTGFVTSNYSWTGPPTFTSAVQNPLISNTPVNGGGIYTVTATSLAAGCTATATTSVTVKPLPTVTPTTPVSICANTPLVLNVNATAGVTYAWTGPNTFTSTLQNPTVNSLATTDMTGTYSITVTLNGCTASNSVSATVKPLPTVTPTTPVSICANTPLVLNVNATAGGTYAWTGPNTFTSTLQNPTVNSLATTGMTGTYSITVTLNGCTASSSVSATVKPLPTVTPTTPVTVCSNTPLTLGVNATASGTYFWSGPGTFTSALQNPTVNSLATTAMTGTYSIIVTLNACSVSGTASVTVNPVVNAPTANDVSISKYTSTTLSAVCTGSTAKWYSASSGGTAIGTGSYTTPVLSATTTYYVACESGGIPNCENSTRTAQTVTITPATSFDSANTGNWNIASTWICSCIPDGTLPVRIMNTHIVTVPTAYTGQAKGLLFMSTGKVTLQGTGKVNVTN